MAMLFDSAVWWYLACGAAGLAVTLLFASLGPTANFLGGLWPWWDHDEFSPRGLRVAAAALTVFAAVFVAAAFHLDPGDPATNPATDTTLYPGQPSLELDGFEPPDGP